MKLKNASQEPKVYYGLHMVEGLAEYHEPQVNNGEPYRILVGEDVLKGMDASYAGKPVYVHHVDEVDLSKMETEAAGYVVESFFNKNDGKHWVKFLVTSDEGHRAISSKWKLSNSYIVKSTGGGGKWHNIEYSKEVLSAEYEHLAIVPNPRYDESIILTPEEFKEYNNKKEDELKKLANSKGEAMKFFKRTKVENALDIENTFYALKSGKELSIAQIINELEKHEEKKNEEEKKKDEPMYANGEHMVKVNDEEMTVNELVEKHLQKCNELEEMKKKDSDDGEEKPKNEEEKKEDSEEEPKKENIEADEEALKKAKELEEHEKEEIKEKKKNSHFEKLKNAPFEAGIQSIELLEDKVARGKSRYGSK